MAFSAPVSPNDTEQPSPRPERAESIDLRPSAPKSESRAATTSASPSLQDLYLWFFFSRTLGLPGIAEGGICRALHCWAFATDFPLLLQAKFPVTVFAIRMTASALLCYSLRLRFLSPTAVPACNHGRIFAERI